MLGMERIPFQPFQSVPRLWNENFLREIEAKLLFLLLLLLLLLV